MTGALETLSDVDRHRLTQVAGMIRLWHGTLRYVDYRQAEAATEALAHRLLAALGREEIARARFSAIPRGGLIVLGMLAYALDLQSWQLSPETGDPAFLHVLVDDCALTGVRFREQLARLKAADVVFAHLYSNPLLREAIVSREPRVRACVAAHDLEDRAPQLMADEGERELWRSRWNERLPGKPYWLGQPELVAFAWTEPDRLFWNRVTQQVDDGWRFVPPHLCLKNRYRYAGPDTESRHVWRTAKGVVTGDFDGTVWIVDLESDRVYSLTHSGADLWRWWTALGDPASVARRLASDYQLGLEEAYAEALSFAARLREQGLLEPAEGPETRP